MNIMRKALLVVILVAAAIAGWLYFVKGYIGVRQRGAVPANLLSEARIRGMDNARFTIDPIRVMHSKLKEVMYESGLEKGKFVNPEVNVLAISGGGANGAFAAGVLCGWTQTGKRPQFDIVTGVSTGALIAPAAFLGESYDSVIRRIYTDISDADIAKQNIIEFIFEGKPSLLDTKPLRGVLNREVDKKVLDAVAKEHAKGRRLYIATTNLDAKRLVVWDMGAIAASGSPEALELFRDVMLASASIPVAFPPVMITVEAGGRLYDEMHADGSIATQMMGWLFIFGHEDIKNKKANIYVIRNGKFADMPEEVSYKAWDIANAAFTTLVTWQSYGDIYRFYTLAKYSRAHFYFTCIPYAFNEPRNSEFDLSYMRKLFYRGYRLGVSDEHWIRQIGGTFTEGASGK